MKNKCALIIIVALFVVSGAWAESISELKKACMWGEGSGCNNLGVMYEQGIGVEKDYKEASKYYQEACDLNNGYGCSNLGVLYYNGYGIARDGKKAIEYCQKACDLNNAIGCYNLGLWYAEGKGIGVSYTEAVYMKGENVRANYEKAAEYYQKACYLGNQNGCEAYQKLSQTLLEMGIGLLLYIGILAVIFGGLYFINKNIYKGFIDKIFRKITIPQGKASRIMAAILIGIQVLAVLSSVTPLLQAPFVLFDGLLLIAVVLGNLFIFALMVLCVYVEIKFLYRYRAFWFYFILALIVSLITTGVFSPNAWQSLLVSHVVQLSMVFHYIWYRKNKHTLIESYQSKPKDEPNIDDVQK